MRYDVPRIIFINKLDRMGANPFNAIESVRTKLGFVCAAVQVPIGSDESLRGLVDIIHEKAYYFDGSNGENIREDKVPDNLLKIVKEKRLELFEKLAEVDEGMEARFLEEDMPTPE